MTESEINALIDKRVASILRDLVFYSIGFTDDSKTKVKVKDLLLTIEDLEHGTFAYDMESKYDYKGLKGRAT